MRRPGGKGASTPSRATTTPRAATRGGSAETPIRCTPAHTASRGTPTPRADRAMASAVPPGAKPTVRPASTAKQRVLARISASTAPRRRRTPTPLASGGQPAGTITASWDERTTTRRPSRRSPRASPWGCSVRPTSPATPTASQWGLRPLRCCRRWRDCRVQFVDGPRRPGQPIPDQGQWFPRRH